MNFLDILGISDAFATLHSTHAHATTSPTQGMASMLPMLIAGGVMFYFMLIRPQNKRVNAQKTMLNNITTGDEIVTTGGLLGKIETIDDHFITLALTDGVSVCVQKRAVASVMPKDTLAS